MGQFTNRELQKCAEREVALRKRVYAKQGMNAQRERELALMIEIVEVLKEVPELIKVRDAWCDAYTEARDAANPAE